MFVSGGIYILFPRIHIALLGTMLVYAGVRVFNFSTFEEYKEIRHEFAAKWLFR